MRLADLERRIELGLDVTAVRLSLSLVGDGEAVAQAGLVAVAFTDEHGQPVEPLGRLARSETFGHYYYVHLDAAPQTTVARTLAVPPGARALTVTGHGWRSPAPVDLAAAPSFSLLVRDADTAFTDLDGNPQPVPVGDYRSTFEVVPGTSCTFTWQTTGSPGSRGLLTFHYQDADGGPLLPPVECGTHEELGAYRYADAGPDGPDDASQTFRVPHAATSLTVVGHHWHGGPVSLAAPPVLQSRTGAPDAAGPHQHDATAWVRSLPEDARLVVVYSTAGSFSSSNKLLLRSNRLAQEMAAAGWHVLYFPFAAPAPDEEGEVRPRLFQVSRSAFGAVFDAAVGRRGPHNVLLCSSFTDMTMVSAQDRCSDHGWRVVYEVRDDMEEFNRVGFSEWYDQNLEVRFARRADAVIAVSPRLRDKMSVLTGRTDVRLIPNAAPDELVERARPLRSRQAWARRAEQPTVGYLGHLTASWFDWPWFLATAGQLEHVRFEVVGHGLPEQVRLPGNVAYLGAMTHLEALPVVAGWTVGVIPFVISRLTYGVDPNKAYEYLAMGLRCVSAPMGSVHEMPLSQVYRSQAEMAALVRTALQQPLTDTELEGLETYVQSATWTRRAADVMAVLGGSGPCHAS